MSEPRKTRNQMERIAFGLAVAAIAGAILPLAWKLNWVLELPVHFRMHSIAVSAALLVFSLIRRDLLIGALCTAALVLSIYPVAMTPVTAESTDDGIIIVSQNLWRQNTDTATTLEALLAQDADVLVLQEYTHEWHTALAPLAARYDQTITHPQEGNFGIAVFTNIHPKSEQTLWLGDGGRPAIVVDLDIPDASFRLIGLHLSAPMTSELANDRNRQLEELADYVSATAIPVVLTGDFNNTPFSPTFRRFLREANLTFAGSRFAATWPSQLGAAGIPIDLAVASDEIAIGCHQTLDAIGSDHRGIRLCARRR